MNEMDKAIKAFNYNTKTEFVREAIRDKLMQLYEERRKQKAWEKLFAMRGKFKGKSKFKTYDEWHDWRSNEGSRELLARLEKKFAVKEK